MEIAGAICLIVGAGLYIGSFVAASRANRGVRMPWWRNPPRNVGRSIAARCVGIGLIVWGALTVPRFLGYFTGSVLIILLAVVPMVVGIGLHNRRVAAEGQEPASSART